MSFYIYVVTKESSGYKIREIPITPNVDESVLVARKVNNYISHFITHTPPDNIIAEVAVDFEGISFL